jgi:nitroreductase
MEWKIIDRVAAAVQKPSESAADPSAAFPEARIPAVASSTPAGPDLSQLIRQRRSAVALDGESILARAEFWRLLSALMPVADSVLYRALPWRPHVHLVLFVHRIAELAPGLYLLARDDTQQSKLQAALRPEFLWQRPEACPDDLSLYLLAEGDLQETARALCCHQDIAADGCFSLGMIAEFASALERHGPWFYGRLFWECGMIGQALYLAAEAAGSRGCGIGCYFDDPVHELLGLTDHTFQSLYHFTVGGAVEDPRLRTLPAYA